MNTPHEHTTTVKHDELDAYAQFLRHSHDQLLAEFTRLDASSRSLTDNGWAGQASEAFEKACDELRTGFHTMMRGYDHLATATRSAHQALTATDTDNQAAVTAAMTELGRDNHG